MAELLAFSPDKITIQVTERLARTYPAVTDALHEHLQEGGEVGGLTGFTKDSAQAIRKSEGRLVAVEGWVWLDETPVAYLIEVRAGGRYTIKGAGLFSR